MLLLSALKGFYFMSHIINPLLTFLNHVLHVLVMAQTNTQYLIILLFLNYMKVESFTSSIISILVLHLSMSAS